MDLNVLTCILHVHLPVASPPSFFSVLYLSAHSISPLFLSPPLSVLLPWFNNPPTDRSTSYRHAPSSLALAFPSAPPTPPLVHARATATTATRGCASSTGGYPWSYSSSAGGGCDADRRKLRLSLSKSLHIMPKRRRRQRATALLQPADIPGLTHLQRAMVVAWTWRKQ